MDCSRREFFRRLFSKDSLRKVASGLSRSGLGEVLGLEGEASMEDVCRSLQGRKRRGLAEIVQASRRGVEPAHDGQHATDREGPSFSQEVSASGEAVELSPATPAQGE